jgi:hypothetical protein
LSDDWMDHVRWSYLHSLRLTALRQGFILVQSSDPDPDAELEGYLTAEWSGQDDESCLFTLLEQATGENCFPDGVTLGQIEDYLATGPSTT